MDKKIGFFKSFWYAITNFEKYKEFAFSNSLQVVKYAVILLVLFSIIVTFSLVIPLIDIFKNGMGYFKDEFPDFTYSEGKLTVNSEEPIYLEDKDTDTMLIVDTNATTDEKRAQYVEEGKAHTYLIILFSDEMCVKTANIGSYSIYEYDELSKNIDFEKLKNMDIMEVKLEDLIDINDLDIDDSLPYEIKILKFVQQIKNPFFFKVGNIIVNSTYNDTKNNIYIEDCLSK